MISCILLERGPAWRADRPLEEQGLGPHRAYLQALAREEVVLAAGPFTGSDGGMVLLSTAGAAEAERILREDPAVVDGIFTGEIRTWHPLIDPLQRLARHKSPSAGERP